MVLPPSLPASAPANASESEDDEAHRDVYEQLRQLVSTYPTVPSGLGGALYHRHPDGWYMILPAMVGAMLAQRHFLARSTDVLLATFPKCGTTWLKALLFATVPRGGDVVEAALAQLMTHNPHELVPSLEIQLYVRDRIPDQGSLPAPRFVGTHIPSRSLPDSVVRTSGCKVKVVYVCSDPKDCLVSLWHFWNTILPEPRDMEEAVQLFCDSVSPDGSYWEQVLGYWRWHVEKHGQVLFMTYEETSVDTLGQLRRLADFELIG